MAKSINNRIDLGGLDEVRRGLKSVGDDARASGNSIRSALINAAGITDQFGSAINRTEVSARASRYALQNLTFQINDVVTSLASGISPFRTFTQQGGQFVQLFQQGGGAGRVLRDFGERLSSMITPARLLGASLIGLGAAFAGLLIRAGNSDEAVRKFDAILKATGRSGQTTGTDLEKIAENYHGIGISVNEARDNITKFLRAGGNPAMVENLIKAGADLNAVFGDGSAERFAQAVATQDVPALEQFARQLNILPDTSKSAFADFREEVKKTNQAVEDSIVQRNRAIVENQRRTAQSIRDLTRIPGTERAFPGQEDTTQKKEILVQAARQEEEIRRQSQQEINDMLVEAARRRNEANRKALEEYNKEITDAANKAGNAAALASQILQRVSGSAAKTLGPFRTAVHNLNVDWENFLQTLQNSSVVQGSLTGLGFGLRALSEFVKNIGPTWDTFLGTVQGVAEILRNIGAIDFTNLGSTWNTFLGTLQGVRDIIVGISLRAIELYNTFKGTVQGLIDIWNNGTQLISDTWNTYVTQPLKTAFDFLIYWAGYFLGLVEKALKAVGLLPTTVPGALLGTGGTTANPTGEFAAGATGGLFHGIGSGTSDSNLARISNGEFIVNAAATRMALPLLNAINSMNGPIMPRRSVGFAMGGLVTAGASSGRPVNIVIGDRIFGGLSGPSGTLKNLEQAARNRRMLSAGRKPSTQS